MLLKVSTCPSVSSDLVSHQPSCAAASAAPQIVWGGTWLALNLQEDLGAAAVLETCSAGILEEPGSLSVAMKLSLVPALLHPSGVIFHVAGEWEHLSV